MRFTARVKLTWRTRQGVSVAALAFVMMTSALARAGDEAPARTPEPAASPPEIVDPPASPSNVEDDERATAADVREEKLSVRDNQWIAIGVSAPLGVRAEIARLRWKHFQFSLLSGGYRLPAFDHACDLNYRRLIWGGIAGVGAKWNFGERQAAEFGFVSYPVSVGTAQIGAGRGGRATGGLGLHQHLRRIQLGCQARRSRPRGSHLLAGR